MINKFSEIEELFKEIDKFVDMNLSIYIIGGAALLKRGLKIATKDIDIIVATKQEFLKLQLILKLTGFIDKLPGKEYSNMNLSQIFQRGDFRIDLFEREVCGKFALTDEMKKRSEKVLELSNINLYLCSNEDIFLFKTMTERDGDIEDCIAIASTQNPNWEIILLELKNQINQSKQDVWITWVGERFDILSDKKVDIPIMNELNILRDKFFDNLDKKHSRT